MPVIRVQDYVKNLNPGTIFTLIASDPGVLHDIPIWCRMHGHQVLSTIAQQQQILIKIQTGIN